MENVNYESFCDKKLGEINSNGVGETQINNRVKKSFKKKIIKIFPKAVTSKRNKKKKNIKKNGKIISLYNVSNRQDDHCNLNEIKYIENTQINIKIKKPEDIYLLTKDCTISKTKKGKQIPKLEVSYPKKRKLFGQWIYCDKYELDINNSKNSFIKKHPEILEKISYFSNNAPKFLSHAFMLVKNEVSKFGQMTINQSIINSEQYQLNHLDYEKFIKIHSKEFNDINMSKKLDELFIEFQAKNESNLEEHNKKVIRFIRNNPTNELFANEYLDLSFYELFNLFNVNRLEDYIKEIKIELDGELKEKNNNNADKNFMENKTNSFIDIIKFLCEKHKEYIDLIDERKKPTNFEKIKK